MAGDLPMSLLCTHKESARATFGSIRAARTAMRRLFGLDDVYFIECYSVAERCPRTLVSLAELERVVLVVLLPVAATSSGEVS